ncbi:alpha/beta hydrolase [Lewinella sp. W8]|uniref:alpha/beta hydrolase n=1 Tax=Lewinella sp. W8 TaxID=2528208 RepID=UPI001067D4A3|nr:alpha/beta hydrolase [Lewinella sp. W8]MTB51655.1 alpha/beta fold hydrolase [Lewinella sp. W8]
MNGKQLLFKGLGHTINTVSYLSPDRAGRIAFKIFATPPKPRIRPKEAAFLGAADRHDLLWRQHRIPVYSWGEKHHPTVFCSYGWGYNAGRWRHFVPGLLEAGYRVVAFDPPGHGLATKGSLTYPDLVDLQQHILETLGKIDLVLAHSFGGGCLVESLTRMPRALHPERLCLMGIFSEVRWIFEVYAQAMGLRRPAFRGMVNHIEGLTGRCLDDFDVARNAQSLSHLPTLLVHDPEDRTTAFRNAERNLSHWSGSALYAPRGAGHHLGTAEVTNKVLHWLIEAQLPTGVIQNSGNLDPMPAIVTREDLMASGGVSDYYQ